MTAMTVRLDVRQGLAAVLAVLALLFLPAMVAAQADAGGESSAPRPAEYQPLAGASLLLDAGRFGDRLIAVGERGYVLYSDTGERWRQSLRVPVSSTLTAITSAPGGQLWAVGHDSTIITSTDGGSSWSLQYFDPGFDPFLDVLFVNDLVGFAIGAYGLLMQTSDAGETWEQQDLNELVTGELFDAEELLPEGDDYADQFADLGCYEFKECHLNGMVDLGNGRLLIVAERGFGYRSEDGGESWEVFRVPYDGSMFGVIATSGRCVLAYGLRGNAFRSCNLGESWSRVAVGTDNSIQGAARDGRQVMLVGNGGLVLVRAGSRQPFLRLSSDGTDLANAVILDRNRWLLLGEEGLQIIRLREGVDLNGEGV